MTATRLTAKGAATRTRIVEAAADRVLERGVQGTSLDDVGAAAGTSRSQLFHYFPGGKTELVRAIVACQGERVLDAQRPAIEALDTWAAWAAWRDLVVGWYAANGGEHGCPIGSLSREAATGDEELREQVAAYMARWRSLLREGVEALRAAGRVRPDVDAEAQAVALLAAVQGGLVLSQAAGDLRPLAIALDAALAALRALAPR